MNQPAKPSISQTQLARLGEFARRVECDLLRGNFDSARRAINEAEKLLAKQPAVKRNAMLHEIGIEDDIANPLWSHGVRTVDDLLKLEKFEFMRIGRMSFGRWNVVVRCLAAHGFEHPDQNPE